MLGATHRRRSFDVDGTFPFSQMLANVLSGKLKTWDILWSLSVFQQQGLGLCPWRPLTWNAGLGGGFHGLGGRDNLDHKIDFINGTLTRADFLRPRLDGRLDFPDRIEADEVAYARLAEFFRRTLTPARRVRRAFARGLDLLSSRWRREL